MIRTFLQVAIKFARSIFQQLLCVCRREPLLHANFMLIPVRSSDCVQFAEAYIVLQALNILAVVQYPRHSTFIICMYIV